MNRQLEPDGPAVGVYRKILDAVGDRADDIGPDRLIGAHWPFVGSQYRRLIVVGQALDGWDAETTTARWRVEDMRDPDGRDALLRGAQSWAAVRAEPMYEVVHRGNRRGKPFWDLSRRVVPILEPELDGVWYARYAWWNVFPLAWGRGSPSGLLKELQRPFIAELFRAVVEELGARCVLLVAGKDWWPEVSALLGIADLPRSTKPVIAAGTSHGTTIVATFHPGAHMKGMTRDAFAAAVLSAVLEVDSGA